MTLTEGVCNSPENKAQDCCFSCQYIIILSFERKGIDSRECGGADGLRGEKPVSVYYRDQIPIGPSGKPLPVNYTEN